MLRTSTLISLFVLCFLLIGCGGGPEGQANTATGPAQPEKTCEPTSDTPTEAYKRLFAAVKERNTDKIKAEVSKSSQAFADSLSARQNNSLDKVYENGFTGTTFSPSLPEIRDERIVGCWAGVEVRNTKEQRWEDLPFVNEDGKWKFAIGELFGGQYKEPGKSLSTKEREAANASGANSVVPSNPANTNSNSKTSTAPAYDGPQVEPANKK